MPEAGSVSLFPKGYKPYYGARSVARCERKSLLYPPLQTAPVLNTDHCQLTVCIKESEDIAGGNRGSQQAGRDQALPFLLTYHADQLQLLQIIIQLIFQDLCRHKNKHVEQKP